MLLLASTSDKIRITTDAAVAVDVHASYADSDGATVTPGRKNTAISTATTTDVVLAPGASVNRNVKTLHARNKGSSAVTVTVIHTDGTTAVELHSVTLLAGEALQYVEGVGFFTLSSGKMDCKLRVTSDVINATTSFADVTGLTMALKSGKHYNFEAHLFHVNDANTTGSRFGWNGPAMTSSRIATIDTVTPSVTASAHSAGSVTAADTAVTAQTTGNTNIRLAILSGWMNPSADGTFAIRCASEVAVAAGLTVKAGSWLRIWEP